MISVIVPYWNEAPYLRRCCKSLRVQDGDFEFLLVNDQSTDGGERIVAEFVAVDSRFRAFDNTHGKGVSGARNTGLDQACGEWVTFLDADDDMMPNAFDIFSKAIEDDPDAEIIQFNHLRHYSAWEERVRDAVNAGCYEMPNLPGWWFGVWNKLIRSELAKSAKYEEQLNYGEDGLYVLELMALGAPIYQAARDLLPVRHWFDNRRSLSHTKTSADVLKQISFYEAFQSRHPEMEPFLSEEIGRLQTKAETLRKSGR